MNAIRSSTITGFMICLPLLIWIWGSIACAETQVNAALIINQALDVLWPLQITAIILSAPWFIRDQSPLECYLASLCLLLIPLPFVSLAWLAAAITLLFIVKILALLSAVALAAVAFVAALNRPPLSAIIPFQLDMPLCLIASAVIWNTSDLWLSWLK